MISIIAAMGKNRELGLNNKLLWQLPADMKYFRQTTLGKPILMGRKTYESFGAKPLPGRKNIVVSNDLSYQSEGSVIVHSIDEALQAAGDVDEIMIIGGDSIYRQTMPLAQRLYLTLVESNFKADTWFPDIDPEKWREVSCQHHSADEKNAFDFSFVIYDRR